MDLTSLALIFVFVTSTLYSSTQIPIILQKQGFLNENYIHLFEKVTNNNSSWSHLSFLDFRWKKWPVISINFTVLHLNHVVNCISCNLKRKNLHSIQHTNIPPHFHVRGAIFAGSSSTLPFQILYAFHSTRVWLQGWRRTGFDYH